MDAMQITMRVTLIVPVVKYIIQSSPYRAPPINLPRRKLFSAIGPNMIPKTTGTALKPALLAKNIIVPKTTIMMTDRKSVV